MSVKYARCAKCRHYYLVNRMVVVECSSCTYRTYRCRTIQCAGDKGANRSINAHSTYWAGRGKGVGGHG